MLEWFKNQFLFNKQLLRSLKDSERALEALSGENAILRDWNTDLKAKVSKLELIIYSKFGLVEESVEPPIAHKSVQKMETWRTAQKKLETIHTPPVDWRAKEAKDIEEGKLSGDSKSIT